MYHNNTFNLKVQKIDIEKPSVLGVPCVPIAEDWLLGEVEKLDEIIPHHCYVLSDSSSGVEARGSFSFSFLLLFWWPLAAR